jgi:DegV family protein with EDD domain
VEKVAIITDSIASLPLGMADKYGIQIVPINIAFDGKIYRDGVDLSTTEAYRMLREKPDLFHSSPAPAGEYVKVIKQAARNTHNILCITLSIRLSSIYNMARLAINQVQAQLPGISIELLDSHTAATGEGLVVEKAAQAASAGKSLAEVLSVARETSEKVHVIGVMDTIRDVYRTGRIPKLAARFGASLNIRPIFVITDGRVKVIGIAKNRPNGISRAENDAA